MLSELWELENTVAGMVMCLPVFVHMPGKGLKSTVAEFSGVGYQ